MKLIKIRNAALVAILGAACTDIQSTDIKTAGMSAHMMIAADGTGATNVSVNLNVDNNGTDYVTLSSGDALVATAGGKNQTLASTNVLGIVSYSAAFNGQDASGTQYTVALNRGTSDTSAPSSTATLPEPFTLGTLSATTYSRAGTDIAVTYSPAGQSDAVAWTITGDCFNAAGSSVSGDTGAFTVSKGTLSGTGSQSTQNCQATLTLTRTRPGSLDPAYYGGTISAVQQRSVTWTSTP
jgi:hypothetical protein